MLYGIYSFEMVALKSEKQIFKSVDVRNLWENSCLAKICAFEDLFVIF